MLQNAGRYRFDFILDQVRVYESKLQQQQTQFEEKTKQFDEPGVEMTITHTCNRTCMV
jgi:hypothetical protein